jgi:carotenoid cleavage dioxygenase-like enzyme
MKRGLTWSWSPVIKLSGNSNANMKYTQWFKSNNGFLGHLSNVYEDDKGFIICDLVMGDKNVFIFWPNVDGKYSSPEGVMTNLRRITIDPHSDDMVLPQPEHLGPYDAEFPRFDERYTGKDYTHTFLDVAVKSDTDWDLIKDKMGGGFMFHNNIGHFNHKTHEWRLFNVGSTSMVQEPVFIPRTPDAPEGDGFVVAVVSRFETFSTDLLILDTRDWTKPQAIIKLPCKLRLGIHGNWVDSSDRLNEVTINGAHSTTSGH